MGFKIRYGFKCLDCYPVFSVSSQFNGFLNGISVIFSTGHVLAEEVRHAQQKCAEKGDNQTQRCEYRADYIPWFSGFIRSPETQEKCPGTYDDGNKMPVVQSEPPVVNNESSLR